MSASNRVPGFLPSTNGLKFANHYDRGNNYPVITLPVVGTIVSHDAEKGLCGGFVFTVMDLFMRDPRFMPSPVNVTPPAGSAFFDYITQRPSPLGLVAGPYCGPGDIPGIIAVLGRCHQVAGASWSRVQATLHVAADDHTGLRAEVYVDTVAAPLQIDGARLVPAGLADASFERGLASWRPFNQAAGVQAQRITGSGHATDGDALLRITSASPNGSVAQDLGRPLSGVTYSFSCWVRAVPGSTASPAGALALWGLDGTAEHVVVPFTATATWTLITATLDIQKDDHTGLRAEIYVTSAGGAIDVDGACLTGAGPAMLACSWPR